MSTPFVLPLSLTTDAVQNRRQGNGSMTKSYRRPRIRAFRALFEAEFGEGEALAALERVLAGANTAHEQKKYARSIVSGVIQNCDSIDALIKKYAPAWPIEQIAAVDRTVLRIALYELLFNNAAVPEGIAINEAVELAKTYGTETSSRFVNGVLGTVSRQKIATLKQEEKETEESRGNI